MRKTLALAGAPVLVTGASNGIGAQVARLLSDRGAEVVVHGRDERRTTEVAREVGGTPVVIDLAEPGAAEALGRRAEAAYGFLDGVVVNAGIGWSGPLATMPLEELRRLLEVNLVAPVELVRLLLPGMVARGRGSLCFVGSVASRNAVAGEAVYAGAKSGLDGFAQSLALELHGTGVHVGTVLPALVNTDFHPDGALGARSWPRPLSALVVAQAVVRTLEGERAETWMPKWLRASSIVRAVAPTAYRSLNVRLGGHR